jgi:hypothetical protein
MDRRDVTAEVGDAGWGLPRLATEHHRASQDAKLARLLTDWVRESWPADEVKLEFMQLEVENRLRSYRAWTKFWRCVQISSWLLIAILGLLITVFAGLKTGHAFTIVAGALVATLTTLTNAAHPSRLADGYEYAREALRQEGWDLLTNSGDYAAAGNDARFAHFKSRVTAIVAAKRSSTKLDSLGPT